MTWIIGNTLVCAMLVAIAVYVAWVSIPKQLKRLDYLLQSIGILIAYIVVTSLIAWSVDELWWRFNRAMDSNIGKPGYEYYGPRERRGRYEYAFYGNPFIQWSPIFGGYYQVLFVKSGKSRVLIPHLLSFAFQIGHTPIKIETDFDYLIIVDDNKVEYVNKNFQPFDKIEPGFWFKN